MGLKRAQYGFIMGFIWVDFLVQSGHEIWLPPEVFWKISAPEMGTGYRCDSAADARGLVLDWIQPAGHYCTSRSDG